MSAEKKRLAILGGGPAGLAAGFFARKAGLEFCIYEAAGRTGGNAITHEINGFRFDSGAHRLHDKDPEMTAVIRSLLGDDLLECEAPSQIYHAGEWIDFPLSPGNLWSKLGWRTSARAARDLARARLKASGSESTFEAFALRAYGREIADRFLLGYTEKLWGIPPRNLSPAIGGTRLKGLDFTTLILESFGGKKRKTRHMDGAFLYPRRGIGMLSEQLDAHCGSDNIRLNSRITRIFHNGSRVEGIEVNRSEAVKVNEVISTLPLPLWFQLMEPAPDASLLRLAATLRFRHVILVGIFLHRPNVTNHATIYFPDADIPITRMYEPKNRSPEMAPRDQTMLVAEIPCWPTDKVWKSGDADLIALVRQHCEQDLKTKADEFMGGCIMRAPFAYPVMEHGIEAKLKELSEGVRGLSNLQFIGRNGTFNYSSLHHMLKFGQKAALHCKEQRNGHAP